MNEEDKKEIVKDSESMANDQPVVNGAKMEMKEETKSNEESIPKMSETVAKPKKNWMKNKKILMLIGGGAFLLLLLLIIIILLIFFFLNKDNEESTDNNASGSGEITVTPTVEDSDGPIVTATPSPAEEPVVYEDENRVAYFKNSNIWVVNNDGSGKTQLTNDGDGNNVRYTTMDWKSPGILSYGRCNADGCKVFNHDVYTDTITEVFQLPPFTNDLNEMKWSHDASMLAYIFVKGDYSKELALRTGGTSSTIKMYAQPPGRGGGYFDGIEIEFSPDDSKMLVLNTIIDPTMYSNIYVFDTAGTTLLEIADGTHPTFEDNGAFYYIEDNKIKRAVIATASSSVVYNFGTEQGYNIKNSPDGYFIAYWSIIGGDQVSLAYYDTGGSPSQIAPGYANPQWLDDNSEYVVALDTEDTIMGMGYSSLGLAKLGRVNGSVVSLDTGNIYYFEVE